MNVLLDMESILGLAGTLAFDAGTRIWAKFVDHLIHIQGKPLYWVFRIIHKCSSFVSRVNHMFFNSDIL